MVVVDNNILSSLAKADSLSLLKRFFKEAKTTPGVMHEFRDESIIGYDFVEKIDEVKTYSETNDRWLKVLSITNEENSQKEKLIEEETGISHTDAECLSVAKNRDDLLLTDDSRLGFLAVQNGIDVYDLETFLLASVKKGVISKREEARKVIKTIEGRDYYTFSESFIEKFFEKMEQDKSS